MRVSWVFASEELIKGRWLVIVVGWDSLRLLTRMPGCESGNCRSLRPILRIYNCYVATGVFWANRVSETVLIQGGGKKFTSVQKAKCHMFSLICRI
jgi:hypothetical protein